MSSKPLVNFLVIGVQKGGTTALWSYLSKHPQICVAPQKEVHFFDNEEIFKSDRVDYNLYHQHFKECRDKKAVGEFTPIYIYWKSAIKRIWEYNPKIKIIILLRNPIERAYSHWNMERKRGAEELEFFEAITKEENRLKEALPLQHRVYSYTDRGFYTSQLREVFRFFDREQVLILKNEELLNSTKETLKRVTDFLEVDEFKEIEFKKVFEGNYNNPMSKEAYLYLRDKFEFEIKALERLLNWNLDSWLKPKYKRSILFLRDYRGYTGGHQKVFDYFKHSIAFGLDTKIYFTKESLWDKNNPWAGYAKYIVDKFNPTNYDFLFIGGMDWLYLPDGIEERVTIINIIQGTRHFNKDTPLYEFLSKKAIRIAVSNEVAKALKATDRVNGEIYTIENGIELSKIDIKKDIDIFILGVKNPTLARELEREINLIDNSLKVALVTEFIDRDKVLEYMARAKISIVLPAIQEGFFLPALEAMNYSDIAIAPDCIGNRGFCKDKINSLVPKYEKEEILKSLLEALDILKDSKRLESMRLKAKESIKHYSIKREREEFFRLLNKIINKRDKNV